MNTESDFEIDLQLFRDDELIDEVLGELKPGKEATVFLVRKGEEVLALKHYRPMLGRHFANSAKYREGRFMKARDARAFTRRSRYGREVAQGSWIAAEFGMAHRLHRAGVPVPRPLAMRGASILMEFIPDSPGSKVTPAPRLSDHRPTAEEARIIHARVMQAIITMMTCNVVHADLSAFNVLVPADGAGRRVTPVIIDFPQAVDPRQNRAARELLAHDIDTITTYCRRFNPEIQDHDLLARLWHEFIEGRLTPPA